MITENRNLEILSQLKAELISRRAEPRNRGSLIQTLSLNQNS